MLGEIIFSASNVPEIINVYEEPSNRIEDLTKQTCELLNKMTLPCVT